MDDILGNLIVGLVIFTLAMAALFVAVTFWYVTLPLAVGGGALYLILAGQARKEAPPPPSPLPPPPPDPTAVFTSCKGCFCSTPGTRIFRCPTCARFFCDVCRTTTPCGPNCSSRIPPVWLGKVGR